MKPSRLLIATIALMSLPQVLYAQEDYDFYLQKARQRLAEGDCSRAEASYNTYKDMAHKTIEEIEQLIEECKNSGSNSTGLKSNSGTGISDGHDYVDLGLPSGTLWATCNMGASKPEGYGNYYSWGETSTKNTYNWSTYKYANDDFNKLTKYCNKSKYGNADFTDYLTTLQSGDDPATSWGSGWRTPSKEQWDELLKHTTNKWTTQNGVKGRLFTSKKNGQTLFLPFAGARYDSGLFYLTLYGRYWSQSLHAVYPSDAWYLSIGSDYCNLDGIHRDSGLSVRPVRQN